MPLAGVVLPTHKEMMNSEPGRYPRWLPPELLLEEAETWGPKDSAWSYEMLKMVFDDIHNSTSVSPTYLLGGCARSKIIERNEDYIVMADDFYVMMKGSLVHNSLELKHRPGSIAEVKFFTTIGGEEFRAIPDLVTPTAVYDYKYTDNPPAYYPYKSNRRQVELNRYVLSNAEKWTYKGEPVDLPFDVRTAEYETLTLVYLGPKWPKQMTIEKKQEFTSVKGVKSMKNQPYVAPDEEVESWLLPLVEIFQIAADAYPKWPKGLEKMYTLDTDGKSKVYPFGGHAGWSCPGKPICNLPNCTAKRWPHGLMWESPEEGKK
jgi:hypothetical protein